MRRAFRYLFTLASAVPLARCVALTVAPTAAGQTLADLWDGRAKFDLAAEKVGGDFTFHCLSIWPQDGTLLAYYIANYTTPDGQAPDGHRPVRSDDGMKWTDEGRLLSVGPAGAWDDRAASFPGIWKDGDTWYLVYEGAADDIGFSPGDIGLATSPDGKNFTKHPGNPILRHEKTGWERVNIGTPSLYKEERHVVPVLSRLRRHALPHRRRQRQGPHRS